METVSNETIKIETADGSVFVYPFTEVVKITKERSNSDQFRKFGITLFPFNFGYLRATSAVKLKSPGIAILISLTTGFFAPGGGQIYNEQYGKAVRFAGMHLVSVWIMGLQTTSSASLGELMRLGNYIYAAVDAGSSAKKINAEIQQKASTSLKYIPHEGILLSYNLKF